MKKSIIFIIGLIFCTSIIVSACNKRPAPDVDFGSSSISSSSGGAPDTDDGVYGTNEQKLTAFADFCSVEQGYCPVNLKEGFTLAEKRKTEGFEDYPLGYGEKTTGGRGALAENVYSVKSGVEFEQAVSDIEQKVSLNPDLKSIILVEGDVTEANASTYQIIVNNVKNLSVIGNGGQFDGVGLNFKSSENVIVQNMKIHHPSRTLHNEKDCLELNACRYIWVDHCEFFNDYPSNSAQKDYYDGLIDLKNESEYVTFSYNYLHDAFKTSLVGSGPSDVYQDRTVTYHHNIFENCNSRLPLFRGGYAHIYNNYYKNILSRCIDTRFGAKVYVENNVFEKAKNLVGNFEEQVGYYNVSGNVTINCSSQMPSTNTTDFTPSYRYTLDDADTLTSYLEKTVGLGKIDIQKAMAMPTDVPPEYQIPTDKIVTRAISELGKVTLQDDYCEKLTFIAKNYSLLSDNEKALVNNIDLYFSAIDEFCSLYASSIVQDVDKIQTDGDFATQAALCYRTQKSYDKLAVLLENKIENMSEFLQKKAYFDSNFKDLFNRRVSALSEASSADRSVIDDLYYLYEFKKDLGGLDKEMLDKANTVCDDKIKIGAFSESLKRFDNVENLSVSDAVSVEMLIRTYNALSETQRSYVSQTDVQKYADIVKKFDELSQKTLKMDLSGVAVGRTSSATVVGDVSLGTSTDVRACNEVFDDTNFDKTVFISGYGNAGSKCIQLNVIKDSKIELIVKVEDSACNLLLTDPQKVVKDSRIVGSTNLVKITFDSVKVGEYRLFTDIPSSDPEAEFNGSKIFIYSVNIIPQ